jgi:glycosyltransferase involved in cell wall biosynthesis
MDSTDNVVVKEYLKQQYHKLASFETRTLCLSDAVGVVSDYDFDLIAYIIPRKKITVIPNGVDLAYFDIERTPRPRHLVSVGSLDWRPNAEGLIWFLDEVWPQVIQHSPEAILSIVGRNPPDSLLERASKNIVVSGSVPDVREYVTPASVFVVPLFSGGGTRLKVLEAMAMRVPIVSTSLGVMGIQCRDGEHVMISDDAEGFARNIIELLDDQFKAHKLALAGRRLVEDKYSWDSVGEKLNSVYESLVLT